MDINRLREETPGVEHRIHLNNAGAGLMPAPVLRVVQEHLELEARIGGYEASDAQGDRIRSAYQAIGRLIGTGPDNIAVTENATASFIQALSSIDFRKGDVLLTTRSDYASNQIQYLSLERRLGIEVVRAPDLPEGGVDAAALGKLIHRRRPRLVAVTHVPTSSGLVQDAAAVGRACRERGAMYLLDACQSVGQLPLDVEELGCDFLTATSRKFLRGPRGIGFLYVSDRVLDEGLEPLFIDLQGADWIEENLYQPSSTARRFENWEFPFALVLGMGEAARYAEAVGVELIAARVRELASLMRATLATMDGVRVLDRGPDLCAIVTISLADRSAARVRDDLRARGINTSYLDRPSAVIDFDEKGIEEALRISPHYYNTTEEIETFCQALEEIL